jgi:hypothetical protein
MPILSIEEQVNPHKKEQQPIRERMDINVPGIPEGYSRRNGAIYLLVGSGGSGKTNMLLNMFKRKGAYRNKFHHIYYFCPNASFASVANHPFENHDKVYHELTMAGLEELKQELMTRKEETEEDDEQEYSAVIIDDFANDLKDKGIQKMLNSMLIKARHLNTTFIFTLQSIGYMPKILRKQLTAASIFKPRNAEEWEMIRSEILQMKRDDAQKIYDYIFDAPYQHLDVDCFDTKFYKNHNYLSITNSNTV